MTFVPLFWRFRLTRDSPLRARVLKTRVRFVLKIMLLRVVTPPRQKIQVRLIRPVRGLTVISFLFRVSRRLLTLFGVVRTQSRFR